MVVVDDAYAPAFAPPNSAPADLADASRARNHHTSSRIAGNVFDERFAFVVGKTFLSVPHERASVNDRDIAVFAHPPYQYANDPPESS